MATVKIEHIQFRGVRKDQPRFSPSQSLRRLGFAARALKHPNGGWFTVAEVLHWLETDFEPDVARRRAARDAGKRLRPRAARRYVTTGEIIETYIRGKATDGAPANTLADYRAKARAIETFDAELYASPAEAIDQPIAFNLYERLRRRKGPATAVGAIRILSAAYGYALRTGAVAMPSGNPCARLRMQTPAPRVRAGTVEEMAALIAAARALGRTDVVTAIMLGLWTGQRQGDRLNLVDSGETERRIVVRQSKTRKIVSIPRSPELVAALAEARTMKAALPFRIIDATIVVNRDTGRRFHRSTYSHLFGDIRAAAVAGIRDATGAWIVKPCKSLADFWDLDLRDTAVTWLVRAGCDVFEVASITGHDLASVHSILKHYLADHPERADAAIEKMVTWYDAETTRNAS